MVALEGGVENGHPVDCNGASEMMADKKEKQPSQGIESAAVYLPTATTVPSETTTKTQNEEESKEEGEGERETWTGKLDFLMSALSFAVGMGNIWRFPYICYRNGGGAFLIPYLTMVLLAGFPLIYLEFAFGQYGSLGVVSIWKACPLFQGIGWTMFAISFISCIYYNMLVAYSFFYLFASFAKDVPWRDCDNDWNTEACKDLFLDANQRNCTVHNGTWLDGACHYVAGVVGLSNNGSGYELSTSGSGVEKLFNASGLVAKPKSPADEYFHNHMLGLSDGLHDMGIVRWQLVLCLLLCWIIVFVCLSKGIKSSGKATYITSTFPYLILFVLFIRGITLEGSGEGIKYYLTPQWDKLLSAKVWGDAAVQVFYSMSICWGGLITLASYNKFNNNCLRDSIVVAVGDCLTSIFAGVVIFAIIGYLANQMKVDIEDVATQGAGLAFIIYQSAVTRLPASPLWSGLFMLVLLNLGLGTQFTLVTTSHTTLLDVFSRQLRVGKRPLLLLLGLCVFCFTVGLVFTSEGGMFVLQLMDSYAPSYALLTVGLCETIVLGWVYGINRFGKNIEEMMGSKPHFVFSIIWKYITPAVILFILLFTIIDFKRSSYGDYEYPVYADMIGWFIAICEIGCIPGVAVYKIITLEREGTLLEKIRYLMTPAEDWDVHDFKLGVPTELKELTLPLNSDDEKPKNIV